MGAGWHARLLSVWARRGLAARLLLPLSLLFRLLIALRHTLYQRGMIPSCRLPVPVIVVGNVMVGGVGKTPVVMALVAHLQSKGIRVGVIARGYGRSTTDCREVLPSNQASEVGDETLLIRQRTGAPVFVARHRVEAAHALLKAHPATQLLLSDDGLQHLALERDVELCVFDDRGLGNGWLLPAGPLREPWPRNLRVGPGQQVPEPWVLHTGGHPAFAGFRASRRLADHALAFDGTHLMLSALAQRARAERLPLIAIAGIAQPEVFFAQLRQHGLLLEQCLALPDHYSFDSWKPISSKPHLLICTEKDAVKLWRTEPLALAVPLQVELPPELLNALEKRVRIKLSSPA